MKLRFAFVCFGLLWFAVRFKSVCGVRCRLRAGVRLDYNARTSVFVELLSLFSFISWWLELLVGFIERGKCRLVETNESFIIFL